MKEVAAKTIEKIQSKGMDKIRGMVGMVGSGNDKKEDQIKEEEKKINTMECIATALESKSDENEGSSTKDTSSGSSLHGSLLSSMMFIISYKIFV